MTIDLSKLTTERRNPRTMELDTFSPLEIATIMNSEDNNVVKGEAEFSKRGDWKNLEFYLGVPETLLPEPVLTTLRQNFSDQAIVSLERDKRGFELTLSDSTEIDISDEGKILDLDKEHRHRKFDKNKSDKAKKFKEPKQDSSATMDSVDAL